MAGNTVTINKSKELEWYVGDSKTAKLIEYLNEVGLREGKTNKAKQEEKSFSDFCKMEVRELALLAVEMQKTNIELLEKCQKLQSMD